MSKDLKFCQSGEISPNLVTLVGVLSAHLLNKQSSICCQCLIKCRIIQCHWSSKIAPPLTFKLCFDCGLIHWQWWRSYSTFVNEKPNNPKNRGRFHRTWWFVFGDVFDTAFRTKLICYFVFQNTYNLGKQTPLHAAVESGQKQVFGLKTIET